MAIDKQLLGKAIRQMRQLRGVSQAALAEEAGLQGNSIALIERGQRGVSME
jgi:transcriptional regulator with XRE-family HTH domain